MSADDYVDEVYYNGQSIRHTGAASAIHDPQDVHPGVPGAVLAVPPTTTSSATPRHSSKCSSTKPQSGWNTQIRLGHPSCKAFGTGGVSGGASGDHKGQNGGPPQRKQPPLWWGRMADDSQWKAPTNQTHHRGLPHQMSPGVWHDQHKYTLLPHSRRRRRVLLSKTGFVVEMPVCTADG